VSHEFILTNAEWEALRDGTADVACWHYGFSAANKDHTPPPQLQELIDVVAGMKLTVRNGK
jgi:hypothetical protein